MGPLSQVASSELRSQSQQIWLSRILILRIQFHLMLYFLLFTVNHPIAKYYEILSQVIKPFSGEQWSSILKEMTLIEVQQKITFSLEITLQCQEEPFSIIGKSLRTFIAINSKRIELFTEILSVVLPKTTSSMRNFVRILRFRM